MIEENENVNCNQLHLIMTFSALNTLLFDVANFTILEFCSC